MLFKSEPMPYWIDIVEPEALTPSFGWYLVLLALVLVLLLVLFVIARRSLRVWLLYARYKLRRLKSDLELQQFVVWLERSLRKQKIAVELMPQLQRLRYSGLPVSKYMLGDFLQRCKKARGR